jgi:hypothetical protein
MSYKLPKEIQLSEPHLARLVILSPRPKTHPLHVFCDFVSSSSVFAKHFDSYLGFASDASLQPCPWVPVVGDRIPAEGVIRIQSTNETNLGSAARNIFSLVIELAPVSFVSNGTSSSPRL